MLEFSPALPAKDTSIRILILALGAFHGSYLSGVKVGVKTNQLMAIRLNPDECC